MICSKISDTEIPVLLSRINEILVEGGSHNVGNYNTNHWNWQYKSLPNTKANIYVIKDGNEIIGYYHVPIYKMQINGQLKKFAMVQDVATSSKYRGKGVFRKLAEYATRDLIEVTKIDGIYTFPNDKSIHTFLKYNNYKQVLSYQSFIYPVNGKKIIDSKLKIPLVNNIAGWVLTKFTQLKTPKLSQGDEVRISDKVSDETADLFSEYSKSFGVSLKRDTVYLNWRFFSKPGPKHVCLSCYHANTLSASIICKPDTILGVDALIVLDFAYYKNHQQDISKLVGYAASNAYQLFNREISLVFTSFSNNNFLSSKKFGFIRIPDKVNPRVLKLLVNKSTKDKEALESKNWHATLADWDVL